MKLTHSLPLVLAAVLGANVGAASAQGGGFNPGELFIYSNGTQGPGYTGAGVLRIDPVTGAASHLVKTWGAFDYVGTIAFDPYRQRLVLSSAIVGEDPSPVTYVWLVDGAGNLQNVSKASYPGAFWNLAPAGDGRIYCTSSADTTKPIRWFDAANQLQTLFAADGVTPFVMDGNTYYQINGMIHDAATNSLFIASITPAPGFPEAAVNVRRLPLSADGSRVVGPVGNSTFEISAIPPAASSGETPRGWSRGPGGKLILNILSIDDEVMPRLLLVDPVTQAISVYASTGDDMPASGWGWATTTGAAYTTALNKVVVVDYSNTKLRAYAQGSAGGAGQVITTAPAALTANAYYLNVISVSPDACSGGWIAYGLGLKGKGNFVPRLTGSGCAEPGAPITLKFADAVGGASAALFVGLTKAALPFKGGSFHVGSLQLTVTLPMGGAAGVAGAGSLSLPTALPLLPALSGISLHLQGAFSDAAAVHGVSLSQGLELEIG